MATGAATILGRATVVEPIQLNDFQPELAKDDRCRRERIHWMSQDSPTDNVVTVYEQRQNVRVENGVAHNPSSSSC